MAQQITTNDLFRTLEFVTAEAGSLQRRLQISEICSLCSSEEASRCRVLYEEELTISSLEKELSSLQIYWMKCENDVLVAGTKNLVGEFSMWHRQTSTEAHRQEESLLSELQQLKYEFMKRMPP